MVARGLLIVCSKGREATIRTSLDRHASWEWEAQPAIALVVVPDRHCNDKQFVNKRIRTAARRDVEHWTLLSAAGIGVTESNLPKHIDVAGTNIPPKTLAKGKSRRSIKRYLSILSLDWMSKAEWDLNHWSHSEVTRDSIKLWISQFDRFCGAGWIGEALIKSFWMSTIPGMGDRLGLNQSKDLLQFEHFCINDYVKGKSAGVIANVVRKRIGAFDRIPAAKLEDLHEVLGNNDVNGEVVWFEDGLYTGTETIATLDSLLGRRNGKSQKAKSLRNPDVLRRVRIQLRFSVQCDFGRLILEKYLSDNSLNNITIAPNNDSEISVLTGEGRAAVSEGTLFTIRGNTKHKELTDPDRHIRPSIAEAWKWESRLERAVKVCRDIGFQLWRSYIHGQVVSAGWSLSLWPDSRIKECSLGMRNLGLTLGLPHSIPKSALPMYWVSADKVHSSGLSSDIKWRPLFLNAL